MLKFKSIFNGEKGGSNLISAAVIFPLMMLIIAGIVQITLLVNAKITVREAAFEALRFGVKSETPERTAEITAYKYSSLPGWVKGGNLYVTSYLSGPVEEAVLNVEITYKVPVISSKIFADSRSGFTDVKSGLIQRRLEDGI